MIKAVDETDIRSVVDGFNEYLRRAEESQAFALTELKNFMEPIFTAAGYREPVNDAKVSNVLILHEAGAGDFVAMSAGIREIRRAYPEAYITLIVSEKGDNLARCCPYVDEVIVKYFFLDTGKTLEAAPDDFVNLTKKYKFHLNVAAEHLLKRRYDIAFAGMYSTNPSMPLLAYMSGAQRRIAHKRGKLYPLLTDVVVQRHRNSHAADKMLSYVEHVIKKRITDRHLEAWFNQEDVDAVKALIPESKKLFAVCLGSKIAKNHYPPASYGALINLLAKEYEQANFIVLGGPTEVAEADAVLANVDEPSRVINLAGKISFRQTAAAIDLCDIYIGNDTGSTHLAAATGTPVLTVHSFPLDLGRTDQNLRRWYPYYVPSVVICPAHALPECKGSKNYRGCAVNKPHCIAQITPTDMFNAYKVLLEQIDKGNEHYVLFNPEKGVV